MSLENLLTREDQSTLPSTDPSTEMLLLSKNKVQVLNF
jgi:hypothetical protein